MVEMALPTSIRRGMNMNAYRRTLAKTVSTLFLAGAFMAVSAPRADAGLIVYVCNDATCSGGDDLMFADQQAGVDTSGALGEISAVIAGVGIQTALSYPEVGDPSSPYLNLHYNVSDDGFDTLGTPYIYAAMDGFTGTGTVGFTANASNGGGTATLFAGSGAFLPSTGTPIINNCVMPCDTSAGSPAFPPSYYLAIGVAPTAGARGAASGDATALTVPDGGTTATLLGSALMLVGMLRRRFGNG